MCGDLPPWSGPALFTRRSLLVGTAAAAAGALLLRHPSPAFGAAAAQATVDLGGVAVIPRSAWDGDLAPAGAIPAEPDVRYLLVHHSVDPGNDYGEGDVAGILRGFVRFHTSSTKGWPDLAYNFLVDRFGRVWEGRTGSLAGPVAGDATGGNQGFDQLCCFIGNHQAAAPTPQAFAAMAGLLGALARRSGVDLGEGATATFTSRGSNRHPAGATVTTPTIAGHRDMSRTQCPGDAVVARLSELRALAAGGAVTVPTARPAPPTTAPPATAPPTTGTAPPTTGTAPPTTGTTAATASGAPPRLTTAPGRTAAASRSGTDDDGGAVGPAAAVAGGVAAAVTTAAATVWARSRRQPSMGSDTESPD